MSVHSEAILNQKFFEMMRLLKIYLNHFPKDEKLALSLSIKNTAIEIFDLITESQKRYHKKTSLTNLDIKHEQLRMEIYQASVLIGQSLEKSKEFKKACEDFVINKLGLQLSHWHIQKIRRGINFVGYRTWKRVKLVRKHSMYKMKKAIKKQKIESIISLIGHAKGTATLRYFRKLLIEFSILEKLPKRTQICLSM